MSADDGVILDQCLSGLASLLYHVELMSIRQHGDGYLDRAWCFFEMLAGIVIADGFAQRFEGPNEAPLMESAERKVMESALLSRNLPRNLAVTRPEDLPRIREMTETTTAFFALHTVMHYLTLGQRLSEQRLFWGEDPYYHLAVCDMTEVAKWVFEKSREHNLPLNAMRNNEKTDNFFLKLAEREDFYHDIDPRRLPKKVTMEQSKLAWFMIRKDKAMSPELESANNLFYILSSLIR